MFAFLIYDYHKGPIELSNLGGLYLKCYFELKQAVTGSFFKFIKNKIIF